MKWQPIETAPKDGTRVLLERNDLVEPVTVGYWNIADCDWRMPVCGMPAVVTHWMPLPPPPSVDDGETDG